MLVFIPLDTVSIKYYMLTSYLYIFILVLDRFLVIFVLVLGSMHLRRTNSISFSVVLLILGLQTKRVIEDVKIELLSLEEQLFQHIIDLKYIVPRKQNGRRSYEIQELNKTP